MPPSKSQVYAAVDQATVRRARAGDSARELIDFLSLNAPYTSETLTCAAWRCHELQLHDDAVPLWKAAVSGALDPYSRESALEEMIESLRGIDYTRFPGALSGLLWAMEMREQHVDRAKVVWLTSASKREYLLAVRDALTAARGALSEPLPMGDEFRSNITDWRTYADACLFHRQFDLGFSALATTLQHGKDINDLLPDVLYRLLKHSMDHSVDLSWTLSDEIAAFLTLQATKWHQNTDDA